VSWACGERERGCACATVRSKPRVMGSVQEIEEAVLKLSAAELAADEWDRQIADDIAAGRLDALADEALDDLRADRSAER